jgi:hypothetical protein
LKEVDGVSAGGAYTEGNKLCKAGKARSADKIRNVANVEA